MGFNIYQKAELWIYLSVIFVLATIVTFLFWIMPAQDLEKLFPPISRIDINLIIPFLTLFVISIFSIFRSRFFRNKIKNLKGN